MDTVVVDGLELEYSTAGSGEPVVMIHGALIAQACKPLLGQSVLTERYEVIAYHRRGYAGSSASKGISRVDQQAADCAALMRQLGLGRAHIVGHSYGACVALQLVLDRPELVHSLALLEPALIAGATADSYRAALREASDLYNPESAEEVVDQFILARWGTGEYRSKFAQVLPGALSQAVRDAQTSFKHELPGLLEWSFGRSEAERISQPVLSILGGDSDALWSRFGEIHRLLLEWLPNARGFVLPHTTHFPQVQDATGLATALAEFFSSQPMAA